MLEQKILENFSIETSWDRVLQEEYKKPYFQNLTLFVKEERESCAKIFPENKLVFNALQKTAYNSVKVVIMGQDPYHGAGQAHGLSFSVPKGITPPPSLKNIFKELASDLGLKVPGHGCLEKWAEQGVLLLNATLTVRESAPLSHHKQGWEVFTDKIIRSLSERQDPVIFLLWGKNAIDKCSRLPELQKHPLHYLLTAPHPSPFSAHTGFLGCRHFSKANDILAKLGKKPIDWQLE